MMNTYSTAQVAERLGISMRTARFYEEKGLLKPQREGKNRRYDDQDVERLQFILDARLWRFTLSQIANSLHSRAAGGTLQLPIPLMKAQRALLVAERADLDGAIEGLDAALASRRKRRVDEEPQATPICASVPDAPAKRARRTHGDDQPEAGSARHGRREASGPRRRSSHADGEEQAETRRS